MIHQWCSLCFDGNPLLVACNKCGAANCGSCVPQLAQISPADLETYKYFCVGCTKRGQSFQVCLRSVRSI